LCTASRFSAYAPKLHDIETTFLIYGIELATTSPRRGELPLQSNPGVARRPFPAPSRGKIMALTSPNRQKTEAVNQWLRCRPLLLNTPRKVSEASGHESVHRPRDGQLITTG